MGRIVFMDDEVTKNDNSRSGITKRMNQDFLISRGSDSGDQQMIAIF